MRRQTDEDRLRAYFATSDMETKEFEEAIESLLRHGIPERIARDLVTRPLWWTP